MSGVGVVIPLYNHGRYIRAAIESALDQGDCVGAVIVIDDGSKDDSVARAREVRDPRLRLIEQENAGAHAAINRGVAELPPGCDHVAILNSDDQYLPERLPRCLDVLDANPPARLAITALELMDDAGQPLGDDHPRRIWYEAVRSLFSSELTLAERVGVANLAVTTSNFVARRDWLAARPFRDYRYVHDYRALIDAMLAGALATLDRPLLRYRVHGANTIDEDARRLVVEMLRLNIDLHADHAGDLRDSPDVRARFAAFQRAAWSSVSSLRQDATHAVLAALADAAGPMAVRETLDSLDPGRFPELSRFPNKRLPSAGSLADLPALTAGLAGKLAASEEARRAAKDGLRAARDAIRLRNAALRSRWMALGRLIGAAPTIHTDPPPGASADPPDARLRSSPWIRLGRLTGSRFCRRLPDHGKM